MTAPRSTGGSPLPAPSLAKRQPVLVTGGAGFIGANLADRLAREGEDVLVYDALARPGVERNVAWLKARHPRRISFTKADVRDSDSLAEAARGAHAVFHFAAQVAVTTSLSDPCGDFAVNTGATLALLEALRRKAPQTPIVFASTNKVYGDLSNLGVSLTGEVWAADDARIRRFGIGEDQPLDFRTPYGCSKGAAEQYVLDYARSFDLPTCVMRMSCIYGPRQMGTEDQGWIAHFLMRLMARQPITIFGDGRQVRDVLFVDDAVEAYVRAWRHIGSVSGRAFNLGGGPPNAVSLLAVIARAEEMLGMKADLVFEPWRPGDQRYYVSDTRQIRTGLGLPVPRKWQEGLKRLADWLQEERGIAAAPTPQAVGA
jgi:CDP-paratose 2-epimerase